MKNTNQKKIERIIKEYKTFFEKKYFLNFAKATYLSKIGQNNLSKKIIENNKLIEKEIGKLYFLSSIGEMNLEDYIFSKKLIGEKFDPYKPVKVNLGKKLIFGEDYLDVLNGELIVVSDEDLISELEFLESRLNSGSNILIMIKKK